MFHIWRTASSRSFDWGCGPSAQAPSCWSERRRQTSWAAAAMPLGLVAACVTSLHHSLLALEPSMALASFSLSLLIQVHEAAAVVASGGDAGDEWRPAAASMRAA